MLMLLSESVTVPRLGPANIIAPQGQTDFPSAARIQRGRSEPFNIPREE